MSDPVVTALKKITDDVALLALMVNGTTAKASKPAPYSDFKKMQENGEPGVPVTAEQ